MSVLFANDLIAGIGLRFNGKLVAHDAAWYVKSFFFSKKCCYFFLKLDYGRVFTEHVVPDFSIRHCLPHCGRRLCYRITSQVNVCHSVVDSVL